MKDKIISHEPEKWSKNTPHHVDQENDPQIQTFRPPGKDLRFSCSRRKKCEVSKTV